MDEAGYLFDGFDPSGSLSVWRSAATDLVINLVKPDFFKNAKAADFLGRFGFFYVALVPETAIRYVLHN